MNKLCLICMRGRSKGLKNKHLKKINNKHLLSFTINQAVNTKMFDAIVVSTDSKKIALACKEYNINLILKRPKYLSTDYVGKVRVIKHAVKEAEKLLNKKFDIVFDLDATSPLRYVSDIKASYKQFLKHNSSNLISGSIAKKNPYFNQVEIRNNKVKIVKKPRKTILRRQDSPKVYDLNASIYIWTKKSLYSQKSLFNKNTTLYIMPDKRSIDIDSILDFKLVETLMKDRKV